MKARLLFVLTCLFLWVGLVTAQTQRVTGVVISEEDGEPVIGASVLVKGTTIGSITNIDGEFDIPNAPSSVKTIVVSYVGMRTVEVAITPGRMQITLKPESEQLEEVVVTAMGISREKKSLGYAITEVKADELTKAGSPSVTSSLTGKVAGVQVNTFGGTVGASSRISVRGNGSLSANQQPMIVVDGVPITNDTQRTGDNYYEGIDYGSGLNDINPEDIESISVLKGGSAALYGMRAGNGVILITTKNGKKGNGVTVSYDMNLTMDRVANIPKLQNLYGQGHNGDEWHFNHQSKYTDYQSYSENVGFDRSYDESWGPRLDVGLNLVQFDSDGKPAPFVSRPNNIRDFFQTGVTMNHMVSVSSNSDRASTRVSLSYRDQKGTVPNTDQKRYTGSFNTTLRLNKWVSYDMSATYTRTKSDNLNAQGYHANNPINSLVAWSARQMNIKSLKANWDQKDEAGNYTYYNWIDVYHVNPYFNVYMNTNSMQRDRIFGKSSLYYQPFEWLKFEGRIGVDYYALKTFERVYFEFDDPDGRFTQNDQKNTEFNADFIASFNKTFGDFNLTAIAGANYRDVTWESGTLGASQLIMPGIYTLSNRVGDPVIGMSHSKIRSNSIYGNFSLGWKNQLYLDASARNDWSSTIRDDFFYPSVSVSWIPTASFESIKGSVLEFLKFRAGWAQIGSATSAYRNSYYYYSGGVFNGVSRMYQSMTYPNLNLKPEKVTTWEIGAEVGLFQDRLHLDVAYYQKKTEDQILTVSTDNTVGFTSMLVNAGEIRNKGIEIQLRGDILKSKNGLNWTSTLNFSKDKSEIVYLYKDPETGEELLPGGVSLGWTWGISNMAIPGQSWGSLKGVGYARITEADVKAGYATADQVGAIKMRANGSPIQDANSIIGHVVPDFLMGWRNEFSIKDFSFGFMLDFRKGGDIWSQTMSHAYQAGVGEPTAKGGIRERDIVGGVDVATDEKFVIPASTDANGTVTSWKTNDIKTNAYSWFNSLYTANETYVFDGSFLKLREAYITWDVPRSILRKTKYFNRATISLIGTNLALLWVDKSNTLRIDPEAGGVSSDSRGVGFEQASTPMSRSFGLKLGLTF